MPCFSMETSIMLSSSCEFDRHIGVLSSCEFYRHIGMLSSCEFESDGYCSTDTSACYHSIHCYQHLVSSTDTSSCYHHLVSSTDTSSCYHHHDHPVLSTDTSARRTPRQHDGCHAFLWKNSPCYHRLVSSTDTSSCYHHLVISTDTSACYHNETSTNARTLL